jgi:non-ribosomal peptide synthase protein (TIGR01720 family)
MVTPLSGSSFEPSTLVEVLRWRALQQPEQRAYTFLVDGEIEEVHLTYADLDRRARAIGARLQSLGAYGERALLVYPPGLEFIAGFFGCLYAGVVAIPVYPPHSPRLDKTLSKFRAIANDAQPVVALTTSALLSLAENIRTQAPDLQPLRWLATDTISSKLAEEWHHPVLSSTSLAFFQYTSGSTATPKGVMLSHGNVLHNSALIKHYFEHTAESRGVIWLPLYHDMGLIGGVLQPLYSAFPTTFLSPFAFLQRPFRWLQAISRTRATTSGGPNFAYDLCVRRITAEQRMSLDLSSWQVAFSGAEPIRHETLEQFAATFEHCGFRRQAFYPCYGLAESTLIVSGGEKAAQPVVRHFQAAALEHNRVVTASFEDDGTRTLVGCGQALLDQRVIVVDPETLTRCSPDQVGEIWVVGPSVAQGYWNRPEETERTFRAYLSNTGEGPFLRTGDLGFLHDGELFITGRLKDLIIVRGRNHYPQDIEYTVERSHPALRRGCGAAFAVEVANEERLVVVQELELRQHPEIDEVVGNIRQAVAEEHEIQVYAVSLIKPGSIPKTTSGKVQRQSCRQAFLEDRLAVIECSILQASIRPQLESGYVPPRTAIEQSLAQIWAQLLRVEQVGIHDNFFQLGGDSLTSMQVIARARQAGLHFTVEQLVEQQTIAELAAVVGTAASIEAEQGLVSGPAPLLPTQQRFFELQPPEYYHHGFYRQCTAQQHLDPSLLAEAVQQVLRHHDALRMRFFREEERWRQVNMESEERHVFSYIDLSWMSREQQEGALAAAGEQLNYTLDLSVGPIMRVTLFDLGPDEPSVVVTVVHHLVTDAVSSRILLEDLGTAYQQLSRGEPVQLPAKTTSLKAWAERLLAYAQSAELRTQLDYWLAEPRRRVAPLPVAPLSHGRGGHQALWLSAEETRALVYDVPRVYGTEINDVLLTALVQAFAEWTGSRCLLVDLVSHGRDPLFPDVDLSRTVGWLASFFPVLLDLGEARGPAQELRSIKEQLRRIPTRGLGYGVLRYVSQDRDVLDALRSLPEPQVRFNYAGTFDQGSPDSTLFSSDHPHAYAPVPGERGMMAFGGEGEESELLVTGQLSHGQLGMVFFSGQVVRDPSIMERLAQNYLEALSTIIASCRSVSSVG